MTSQRNTGRVIGALRSENGAGVIRVEDSFDTGIEDLWNAISDPERLARWVAEVHGDLSVGGEFTARFTSTWEGSGRVDVCEPPHRLLVTMLVGQPEETVVEAWLRPDGDRTVLTVEERGLPLAEVAAHGAGWQVHLEDLGDYLRAGETSPWHGRWVELRPTYEQLAW